MLEILFHYEWQPSYRWLFLDVVSLYTSIDHIHGLRAINYYLLEDGKLNSLQAKFLLDCVEYSLTHNYFSFLGEHYLQIKGKAMGARFSPSYANQFMGYWEKSFIWKNNPFGANLVLFARYIDDILIIWDGISSPRPTLNQVGVTPFCMLEVTITLDGSKMSHMDSFAV